MALCLSRVQLCDSRAIPLFWPISDVWWVKTTIDSTVQQVRFNVTCKLLITDLSLEIKCTRSSAAACGLKSYSIKHIGAYFPILSTFVRQKHLWSLIWLNFFKFNVLLSIEVAYSYVILAHKGVTVANKGPTYLTNLKFRFSTLIQNLTLLLVSLRNSLVTWSPLPSRRGGKSCESD